MACVPTNSMILVILKTILGFVRHSEAEVEDCGMRKRAWLLAQIAQHDYIHPYRPTNESYIILFSHYVVV